MAKDKLAYINNEYRDRIGTGDQIPNPVKEEDRTERKTYTITHDWELILRLIQDPSLLESLKQLNQQMMAQVGNNNHIHNEMIHGSKNSSREDGISMNNENDKLLNDIAKDIRHVKTKFDENNSSIKQRLENVSIDIARIDERTKNLDTLPTKEFVEVQVSNLEKNITGKQHEMDKQLSDIKSELTYAKWFILAIIAAFGLFLRLF